LPNTKLKPRWDLHGLRVESAVPLLASLQLSLPPLTLHFLPPDFPPTLKSRTPPELGHHADKPVGFQDSSQKPVQALMPPGALAELLGQASGRHQNGLCDYRNLQHGSSNGRIDGQQGKRPQRKESAEPNAVELRGQHCVQADSCFCRAQDGILLPNTLREIDRAIWACSVVGPSGQ
jgi:hypothetical protein